MTDDELARLERLSAEAAPGPWRADQWSPRRSDVVTESPHGEYVIARMDPSDAELTASARTALPQLVAEVRALRAVVAAARACVATEAEWDRCDGGLAEMDEIMDRQRAAWRQLASALAATEVTRAE